MYQEVNEVSLGKWNFRCKLIISLFITRFMGCIAFNKVLKEDPDFCIHLNRKNVKSSYQIRIIYKSRISLRSDVKFETAREIKK